MSEYTPEQVEQFVLSGDAEKHEDGSVRWAIDNSLGKKPGTWAQRPPQAAPLITSEISTELGELRQEKRRMAVEEGFAVGVGNVLKQTLTTDEALQAFVANLAQVAMNSERKDFSRLASLLLEVLEVKSGPKVEVDARKQTIVVSKDELGVIENYQRLISQDE